VTAVSSNRKTWGFRQWTAHRDPLTLATDNCLGLRSTSSTIRACGRLVDPRLDLGFRDSVSGAVRTTCFRDRHVRIKRRNSGTPWRCRWSFGHVVTTSPPIMMSPSVISSSPAIIRSVVDFPHRRPDQHDELMVGDVEIDAAHRLDVVRNA